MPANKAHLQSDLEEAVLGGALTLTEAWALQDQLLLAEGSEVEMPWELEPQMCKLWLYQVPGHNQLPL